ncbi:MAG TPA: uracil-DNA glycosylase family protein [Actinomycetota bacterium]|nr:uracil-DNA glycosylase family protein [Actinomycetota bacterium]
MGTATSARMKRGSGRSIAARVSFARGAAPPNPSAIGALRPRTPALRHRATLVGAEYSAWQDGAKRLLVTARRKQRPDGRSLVMPPGRRIPRSPSPKPSRPAPPASDREIDPAVEKAAGELTSGWTRIRDCTACERACPERAYGSGHPRSPIMLVKEHPSPEDLESTNAFTSDADALAKAFDALGIPVSWLYGATAVRCGPAPASADQVSACARHLLNEIEAVGPRVIVAFGGRAAEAIAALDGRCGLKVPADVVRGKPVQVRSDLVLMVTEPLPEGITHKDGKRRLWRDLRALPDLVGA